jgi:hypothetical protein
VRCLAYLSIASRQLGDTQSLREESDQLFELSSAIGELAYQGISDEKPAATRRAPRGGVARLVALVRGEPRNVEPARD